MSLKASLYREGHSQANLVTFQESNISGKNDYEGTHVRNERSIFWWCYAKYLYYATACVIKIESYEAVVIAQYEFLYSVEKKWFLMGHTHCPKVTEPEELDT